MNRQVAIMTAIMIGASIVIASVLTLFLAVR